MKLSKSNLAENACVGSELGALTIAALPGGDDDDDDFQNPSQAIALSQSLTVSSLKNSRSQPLKLSNGCHSRKRLRHCIANGKENENVLKKRCSVSRFSKDAEEKIPAFTKRKELCNEISVAGLDNRDIDTGCFVEDGIEDSKTNLRAPVELNITEKIAGKGSQHLVSVEASLFKSVVSTSSNFDHDCSDICTNKGAIGKQLRSSWDLEKSMDMRVSESAHECNVYHESEIGRACLASMESRLQEEEWSIRETGIQVLDNSVDQGLIEDKAGYSFEALLLELKEKDNSSEQLSYSLGRDCCNELNMIRKLQEPKELEKGPFKGMQSLSARDCEPEIVPLNKKEKYNYTRSIEAKLLDSRERFVSCKIKHGYAEVDDCEEFQPGTQLNMLMNLCCELDNQVCSGGGITFFEHIKPTTESTALETNLLVECPLCQTDITTLSEEMRQIHTNECLDKENATREFIPIDQEKPNARQLVDGNPVLEWLRAMDLCRYEELFVKEEIDWDTLQWLSEEDLISIGVAALGPRKKIVRALKELHQRNSLAPVGESDTSNAAANEKKTMSLPGNKLITEFFQWPSAYKERSSIPMKLFCNIEKPSKDPIRTRVDNRRHANRRKLKDIPPWCCISGTPFRVDAFRYLRGDCSHWFLTHFHMDHYQGLTKNFCHGKIYCSKITAQLVNMKIGVPWDKIQVLPLNQKICIAGVNLTCLDANHCPGSIIILFEPSNNKSILHTGDFRFSPEMVDSSLLQSSRIHTLILDTTYCNPQYDFPKQEEVVQFVIEAIQAEAFNPKTLFLIGTYTIGKERLFLEVGRALKKKLYVGAGKLHLLKCLDLPQEDIQLFTENEMESHVHVVPMWTIASFKRMKHISNQYMGRYNLIVAFSPTGWTSGKGKKKAPGRRWQQGTVIRYEVPYSEHSSFTELKEFVRFISPEVIIPSVNNEGPESVDAILALLLSDS